MDFNKVLVRMNAWGCYCVLLLLIGVVNGFSVIPSRVLHSNMRNRPTAAKATTTHFLAKPKSQTVQLDVPTVVNSDDTICMSKDGRLYPDSQDLIDWVEKFGGNFKADIVLDKDSWSLAAHSSAPANTPLIRIPKKLCIFAESNGAGSPLLEGTSLLMNSLDSSQWRARLAIALLSERSRPDSFFFPYLRNLPAEINVPLFYTEDELIETQDPEILRRTTEQANFLSEFAQSVLGPLQKTTLDPFSGEQANLESLAWGFAAASSRALRNIQTPETYLSGVDTSSERVIETSAVVSESVEEKQAITSANRSSLKDTQDASQDTTTSHGPVMIPAIDLAAHSLTPSCAVRDTGSEFVLYTLRPVQAGEDLTIHYGAFSNEELLGDYGFSLANNPFDVVQFDVDEVVLNAARGVAGQCNYTAFSGLPTGTNLGDSDSDGKNWVSNDEPVGDNNPNTAILRDGLASLPSVLREETLQEWQKVWLSCLNLQDVFTEGKRMYFGRTPSHIRTTGRGKFRHQDEEQEVSTVRAPDYNPQVDPRLLALLRVLYATHESDLLGRGFDPASLQRSGSLTSSSQESEVVRTVLGLLSIATRHLGTDLAFDLRALKECILPEQAEKEEKGTKSLMRRTQESSADAIKAECRAVLRSVLQATRAARTSEARGETSAPSLSVGQVGSVLTSVGDTDNVEPSQHVQNVASLSATRTAPLRASILTQASSKDNTHLVQGTTHYAPALSLLNSMRKHSAHSDEVLMQQANTTAEVLGDFKGVQRWGADLDAHTREAYKYRIHRKKMLRDMMVQFVDIYEMLNPADSSTSGLHAEDTLQLPALLAGISASAHSAKVKAAAEAQAHAIKMQKLVHMQKKRLSANEAALEGVRKMSAQWVRAQAVSGGLNL